MPHENQPAGYRIGDLTLDLVHREIRRRGETLRCGKLTFELLVLLAECAPRVVSRQALADSLWAGRYVSPATVKRRVALLRQTLGDRADCPVYIKVVRGQGYSLLPRVHALDAHPPRSRAWVGLAAAAAVCLAFLSGAEIGYQDGLKPGIPELQGSASIFVTSWPYELPQDEYRFVMETAQRFLNVINDSNVVDRLAQGGSGAETARRDALTVLANATSNDLDSLHLTLALLNDSRPDHRPSRADALTAWSTALRDRPIQASESADRLDALTADLRPATATQHHVRVFQPAPSHDEHFVLIATFKFDRTELHAYPDEIQTDAALSVAMAIDEQVASLSSGGPSRPAQW